MARPSNPVHRNPAWSDLGALSASWSGWVIRGEELISPEGYKIPVSWIRALPLTREALHGHQVQSRLQREDALKAHQIVLAAEGMAHALGALENAWAVFRAAVPTIITATTCGAGAMRLTPSNTP